MVNESLGLFFPKELQRIRSNRCPTCNEEIDINTFKDTLSLKEFHISGLCQKCQDKTFDSEEERMTYTKHIQDLTTEIEKKERCAFCFKRFTNKGRPNLTGYCNDCYELIRKGALGVLRKKLISRLENLRGEK